MDNERLRQIKAYRRALDRVLLTGDIKKLRAFMKANGAPEPSTDEALEVTMHKVTTAAQSLPIEFRQASKAWLVARGYHSLDDGDL